MIKLAISGCCGKMGTRILNLALQGKSFSVVCALEKKGHPLIGKKISNLEVCDDIEKIKGADVLVEFTTPESTIEHLDICVKYNKPMVIGTTGLSQEQQDKIKIASKKIPIVFSPNMSIGVNFLFKLVRESAQKLSKDYKVLITEAHHIHKKDKPSGTAKKLAQIIKEWRGEDVEEIRSIREDEIIGDHEVIFDSEYDTIKLSHSAKSRDIFAKGALAAAQLVVNKKNGIFGMEDIL